MTEPTRYPGIVNRAAVPAPSGGPVDILGELRRAVAAIAERDRLHPGPVAGTDLTVAEFGDLMRRGPYPRLVAVSLATAEQWRRPDGMVRIVTASEAAEKAAAARHFEAVRRFRERQAILDGDAARSFFRGTTGL